MMNYKYQFNQLLYQYNKCRKKLANLQIKNRNIHRQQLLEKRITQLYKKLTSLKHAIKLSAATATAIIGISLATPQTGHAQSFLAPQLNPYGLTQQSNYNSSPAFVDMDGDGDLDMLSGGSNGNFYYFEDTSSTGTPAFDAPQMNPFGLTATYSSFGPASSPTFVDMDGDGDMDMVSGSNSYYGGSIYYYEDTSSTSTPAFDTPVINPFGISVPTYSYKVSAPVFVDLDGDGDMDMLIGDNQGDFYYYQDTSSTSTPAFDAPQMNPFGLTSINSSYYSFSSPTFADIDGDGDMDMISGDYYGNFYYFKNTGTATAPAFAAQVENTLGLTTVPGANNWGAVYASPTFVDIDGDGDFDILTGNYYGDFYLYKFCAPTNDSINVLACGGSYTSPSGNYVWTTPGYHNDTLTNAGGCDSVLTINLSFHVVNTYVVQNGNTLTASATNATYQWMTCSGFAITGDTNQAFTAVANGYYAVKVTDTTGCTDTSSCYTVSTTGIANNEQSTYNIYPNPVNNKLNISGAKNITQVEVYSVDGKLLEKVSPKENTANITIDFEKYQKGTYLVKLYFKSGETATNLITK